MAIAATAFSTFTGTGWPRRTLSMRPAGDTKSNEISPPPIFTFSAWKSPSPSP